jgi:membrane-bound serine protease (ClpP class)
MWLGPNTAFVLAIFGVLSIYCEFVWPGRVYPGLWGAVSLAAGVYFLVRNGPTATGVLLIALGAVLLILEALWKVDFVAGILGTMSIAAGFCRLFDGQHRIVPGLAIPLCIMLGSISILLAQGAKQARRNKWSDVSEGK